MAGLLRKELDKGLTIREISRKLGIGYRPVHNHITAMVKEGLILARKVGMARQCFLNLENAMCRQILAEADLIKKEELFRRDQKLKAVLESLITRLSETSVSGIHSIILFGSHAKGTATKSSDIDLMFIVSDLTDKNIRENIERECSSYQYSHNIRISPLITDVSEFRKMLRSKELNVAKEVRDYGLPLYGSEIFWRLMS